VGHFLVYNVEPGWQLRTRPPHTTQINLPWVPTHQTSSRGQSWQVQDCIHRSAERGWEWALNIDIDEYLIVAPLPSLPPAAHTPLTWSNAVALTKRAECHSQARLSLGGAQPEASAATLPDLIRLLLAQHGEDLAAITIGSRRASTFSQLQLPPSCIMPECSCNIRRCPNMSAIGLGIGDLELCTDAVGRRHTLVNTARTLSTGIHNFGLCKAGMKAERCQNTYNARISEISFLHLADTTKNVANQTNRYWGMPGGGLGR